VSFATQALRTLTLALLSGLSLPLAAQTQTPFSGMPIQLPGIIEAENFDNGGEGVAYHDNVAGNAGGQYRTNDSVDIIVTRDPAGGGYSVNNFETGEWMAYTVDIQAAGQYEIAIRTANGGATATAFRVEIDGANVTGSVPVAPTGGWSVYQWVPKRGVSLPAGRHVLKLVSEQQYFDVNQIRVTATPTTPYAGVIPLPGPIEAENYDNGGQDISYSDTTATNDGGQFRADGVDLIASRDPDDAGAGYAVNNFRTGEWLVYTVSVANTGLYDIEARVATGTLATAAFHIEIDGVNVTGSLVPGATGNFGTFQWVKKPSVQLSAGQHVLKLVSDQEPVDVNRIRVTAVTHTPFSGTPISLPGRFEAEHFDRGGEGFAYHDNVPGNAGGAGAYRPDEDVDTRVSKDPEGGDYVVYNFDNNEWLVYTVNVEQSGTYDIELRLASGTSSTSAFHVEIDDVNVTGTVSVPATGSFGAFQWVGKKGVALTAGQHVLKLVADQQYFDVNQIRVVAAAPTQDPDELKFRSGFEGATALGPVERCGGSRCLQEIRGTDSTTGFTWPPNFITGDKAFDLRPNHPQPTSADTIGQYMFNQIQAGAGRNGSRAVYSEIRLNGSGNTNPQGGGSTQLPYMIFPPADVPEFYLSYWVKLQSNLVKKMTVAFDWRVLFEWKTQDDVRRLKLEIIQSNFGKPYWRAMLDDRSSGDSVRKWVEPPEAPTSPTSPAFSIPVLVGEWFKVEVYWKRSAGGNLRAWMAINGQKFVDRTGPDMGTANWINRIFVTQLYTSTSYPVFQWVDGLQIWSTFPTASPGDPWYDPPYGQH
jgi:hypothetical protein